MSFKEVSCSKFLDPGSHSRDCSKSKCSEFWIISTTISKLGLVQNSGLVGFVNKDLLELVSLQGLICREMKVYMNTICVIVELKDLLNEIKFDTLSSYKIE